MIILGIDPGTIVAGFCIMNVLDKKISIYDYGIIKFNRKMMLQSRIFQFYNDINELIVKHNVECISLETPYLGENAQAFLKLGYLRGIVYLICEQKKISLREFAPTVIKQQVTGSGRATKEEVQAMIKQLFPKIGIFETLDASDAVAIALCGAIKRD